MNELDIEAIVQYAKELSPEARPRIISYITPSDMLAAKTCWRLNRERSTKIETESVRKPEKIEQKFAHSRLPQGMR